MQEMKVLLMFLEAVLLMVGGYCFANIGDEILQKTILFALLLAVFVEK